MRECGRIPYSCSRAPSKPSAHSFVPPIIPPCVLFPSSGFLLLPAVTLPRRSFVLLLFLLPRALSPALFLTAGLLLLPPQGLLLTTGLLLCLPTFLTTVTLPLSFVPSQFWVTGLSPVHPLLHIPLLPLPHISTAPVLFFTLVLLPPVWTSLLASQIPLTALSLPTLSPWGCPALTFWLSGVPSFLM